MYVVLEWNQASGRPSIYRGDLHEDRRYAIEVAEEATEEATSMGRRERYTVHALSDDPVWAEVEEG